jgi:hypothetical protein
VKPSRSWTFRTNESRESQAALVVLFFIAVAIAMLCMTTNAHAQGKVDAAAKALQKKAMEEDYLSTEFTKAADKLEKAIAQCGTDKCAPALRSRLKRDLGVVQIGGAIDKEKGIHNFVEAIKIDPAVTLEADIRTKDLDAAFAEAKKRAAGGGGEKPAVEKPAGGTKGQPQGDFVHTPAPEQTIRTPIPVYVEYEGDAQLSKVIVRYKGFGMTDWKTVELKKMGEKAFGGLLPCGDVQQGTTQYYIQGFDPNNDPVATGGDRNNPYKVPVRSEKVEEPPHLPNASPPNQCQDTGDCPPNFPGCKKKGAAAAAAESTEPTGKDGGEFCEDDSECKSNQCKSSKCTDYEGGPKKSGARFWVGITGALDYVFVPTAEDVCKVHPKDATDTNLTPTPVNDSNYYCVRSDGTDYPSRSVKAENDSILLSKDRGSDKVAGGGALGNIRLMLSADYAVNGNLLLGARVGLVLNGYPGTEAGVDGKRFAAPIHLELRLTYVIGDAPIFSKGFAPYVFIGIGAGQFETKVPVQVIEVKPGAPAEKRDVDAWHLAGPAFLAVGGGGRYAITQKFAIMFGLRANFVFGSSFAPSIGPELGGAIGF